MFEMRAPSFDGLSLEIEDFLLAQSIHSFGNFADAKLYRWMEMT